MYSLESDKTIKGKGTNRTTDFYEKFRVDNWHCQITAKA